MVAGRCPQELPHICSVPGSYATYGISRPIGAPTVPLGKTQQSAARPALRTPPRQTTTPRLGGGVRTSFPKLAAVQGGWLPVKQRPCLAFVNAAPQNITCSRTIRSSTLCTAAMRPLVALSAFLDVSSLNLAVPRGAAFFCPCTAQHLRHDRASAASVHRRRLLTQYRLRHHTP
jgi:hypothetical protein